MTVKIYRERERVRRERERERFTVFGQVMVGWRVKIQLSLVFLSCHFSPHLDRNGRKYRQKK